jgi:GST-like protein
MPAATRSNGRGCGVYTLLGNPGWGSVIVEAQLAFYGLPYRVEDVGDLFMSEAARQRLEPFNPVGQVPALILPDGAIMTESAAITLHLADIAANSALVPAPGEAMRPSFLRWLVFLVANIYPTFTFADEPQRFVPHAEARDGYRATVDAHAQKLWRIVEAAAAAPWYLGGRFSALDIYVCAMTRWRPKRLWFAEHCPKLAAIAAATDDLPKLAPVWGRNFPD